MDSQENWTIKYAKKKLNLVSREEISDSDRYKTDRYEIVVSAISTNIGYSVSLHINNAQMGIAGYSQYWQYGEDEYESALRTFRKIKRITKELVKKFEHERIPMSIISPYFRSELDLIDKEHQERSGVQNFNYYMKTHKEDDWRETLYGQRYPDLNFQHNNIMQNQHTDSSQSIETSGNSRKKQYKVKRASEDHQMIKYASIDLEASLESVKQWIQDRWTRTGLPFTAGALATATAFLSNGNWPGFEQTEKSLQSQVQVSPATVNQTNQTNQIETKQIIKAFPVSFNHAMKIMLKNEGGYSNDKDDKGGETNFGITKKTYERWKGHKTDIKNLSQNEIYEFYYQNFWMKIHGNDLPYLAAIQAFDYAVNSGPERAISAIQTTVGLKPTGVFDQNTTKNIQLYLQNHSLQDLANGILNARQSFLNKAFQRGGINSKFKKGLMNRIENMRKHNLTQNSQPQPKSKIKQKIPQQKAKKMVDRVTHKITPDILPFETKQTDLFDKGAAVDMLSSQMSKCSSSDMANMPKLWTKIALKLKAKGMTSEAIEYLGNIYAAYSYHIMSQHISDWKIKF